MSLDKLIHKCVQRDRVAQGELYARFSPRMYAVCLKYSKNEVEAQDNLQEAFLLIFDKINKFNFKGSFEGWMRRVVVNYVLQTYRKKSPLKLVNENEIMDDNSEVFEVEIEQTISSKRLLEIIQNLPDRYRLIFNLYALDSYTHKEISEMLGISIGTSKSNLSRARMILKKEVEKEYKKSNITIA